MTKATSNAAAPIIELHGADLRSQFRSLIHDSFEWLQGHWLQILIAGVAAAVIVVALHWVRRWAVRLCERGSGIANWYSIVGRAIAKTGNFFIIMAALRLVVGYANAPELVDETIRFLFTIAAVFQAAIWVREIIFGMIEHKTNSEHYHGAGLASAMGIIRLLVSLGLFSIALVMVLGNLGVNVTGLVAGLGVGGIAIGLAAQGIFGDLIAALSIIFDRPFSVGQNIQYDQTGGTVEAIGLKSTRIRAYTGELRVISNRQLLDKEIQNVTDRRLIRFSYTLSLARETAPELLERLPGIVKELVDAAGGTLSRFGFANFGASSLDFELIVDVPGSDWATANAVRDQFPAAFLRRFDAEGIRFAYPTQTTFTAAPDGTLVMPYADPAVSPAGVAAQA